MRGERGPAEMWVWVWVWRERWSVMECRMGARLPAGVNKPRSHTFRVFFVSEPPSFSFISVSFSFIFLPFPAAKPFHSNQPPGRLRFHRAECIWRKLHRNYIKHMKHRPTTQNLAPLLKILYNWLCTVELTIFLLCCSFRWVILIRLLNFQSLSFYVYTYNWLFDIQQWLKWNHSSIIYCGPPLFGVFIGLLFNWLNFSLLNSM